MSNYTVAIIGTPVMGVGAVSYPTSELGLHPAFFASRGNQRLPTDPIGVTIVTFQGVNVDSEIRVYLPDGTEAAGIENCAANQVLSWSVYSVGNANNTVRVVIVNSFYKIKEFSYTASVGIASLPVQQEIDKWYYNSPLVGERI